jgi:uncharacterized membrane protein
MTIVQTLVLWALAAVFIVASILHFTRLRADFAKIVPPQLPKPEAIVFITGVLELIGGVALLIPALTFYAGIALIVYLVAVFPANVYAAQQDIRVGGLSSRPLWRRFLIQVLLIVLLAWVTFAP